MGSCISKCKPSRKKNSNRKPEEEAEDQCNGGVVKVPVEDKLVIIASESPLLESSSPSPLPLSLSTTQSPSFLYPFSPSHASSSSSSSFSSSVSCSNTSHNSSYNSSLSSASSCASSISTSKDKPSFSNEFLRSCLEKHSQIVLLDPTKPDGGCVGRAPPSLPHHHHNHRRVQPPFGGKWQSSSIPGKPNSPAAGSTQKRQRATSPNLTRQKSFRRDPVGSTVSKPSSLRSPSPSRRFSSTADSNDHGWSKGGALAGGQNEKNCKRMVANSTDNSNYGKSNISVGSNSSVKKANLKGLGDPNNRSRRSYRSPSMRKQTEICSLNRVVSRVDEIAIGEEKGASSQDVEMLPVEDLDNPLIALDCFIFL